MPISYYKKEITDRIDNTTLSEIIEYSKQNANLEEGGFLLSTQMALLHLPYMIQRLLPFF